LQIPQGSPLPPRTNLHSTAIAPEGEAPKGDEDKQKEGKMEGVQDLMRDWVVTLMISTHFSLEEDQLTFLNQYQQYGFKDQNELIQAALRRLQEELELGHLQESADLYAELYESDRELQELTNSALLEP
jgi:hypothetical protein